MLQFESIMDSNWQLHRLVLFVQGWKCFDSWMKSCTLNSCLLASFHCCLFSFCCCVISSCWSFVSCSACSSNCMTCYSASTCSQCDDGYALNGGACQAVSCFTGTYLNGSTCSGSESAFGIDRVASFVCIAIAFSSWVLLCFFSCLMNGWSD